MQAKDIPDVPVLEFLIATQRRMALGANWYPPSENSVTHAMPPNTPPKVALAKMRALIRRGLARGCCCGCRGDFTITEQGRIWLSDHDGTPYVIRKL